MFTNFLPTPFRFAHIGTMQRFVLLSLLSMLRHAAAVRATEEGLENLLAADGDAAATSEGQLVQQKSGDDGLCPMCTRRASQPKSSAPAQADPSDEGGLSKLQAFALEAQINRHARDVPFGKKEWMLQNQYEVFFTKALSSEMQGMNGALRVFEFTYRGPPVEGQVHFDGLALHKSSQNRTDDEGHVVWGRQVETEAILTKEMSADDGLSVGFVGASAQRTRQLSVHMLTEYVESKDVFTILFESRALLDRDGRFTCMQNPEVEQFFMGQLFFNLMKLETHGMVHRDIKTENMLFPTDCVDLLKRKSTVQEWVDQLCAMTLIDYGLGCKADSTDEGPPVGCQYKPEYTVGTPGVAPPEAYKGIVQHKGDVYSMGTVAMDFLAGGWIPGRAANTRDPEKRGRAIRSQKDSSTLTQAQKQLEQRGASEPTKKAILSMIEGKDHQSRPTGSQLFHDHTPEHIRGQVEKLSANILEKRKGRQYLSL